MIEQLLSKQLRAIADKIDAGECNMTPQEAMDIMRAVCHEPMSKEQACTYLNVSRATFDNMVRDGRMPAGRKRQGMKELVWYRDELDMNI